MASFPVGLFLSRFFRGIGGISRDAACIYFYTLQFAIADSCGVWSLACRDRTGNPLLVSVVRFGVVQVTQLPLLDRTEEPDKKSPPPIPIISHSNLVRVYRIWTISSSKLKEKRL